MDYDLAIVVQTQTQSKTTLPLFYDNQQFSIKSLYNSIDIQCGFLKIFWGYVITFLRFQEN